MAQTCPKCAYAGLTTDECPRCRVIVSKYRSSVQNLARGRGESSVTSKSRAYIAYWIISSARCSSEGGIVSPIAFAVLRLITSSNLVGCSTGRSAGLAPFRILST